MNENQIYLEIQRVGGIITFLENEDDLNGIFPRPLMRSFAVRHGRTFQQMIRDEHDDRLVFYRSLMSSLLSQQQQLNIGRNKKQKMSLNYE